MQGIKNKIPHLKGLGVTTIWISPVLKQVPFENSYHGYGIQDFLAVDPHFDTNNDLKDLVADAHAAGLYVILDTIINHSGNLFSYDRALYGPYSPNYYNGQNYVVQGFNDANGQPNVGFSSNVNASANEAIWPSELRDPATFSQKGKSHTGIVLPSFLTEISKRSRIYT